MDFLIVKRLNLWRFLLKRNIWKFEDYKIYFRKKKNKVRQEIKNCKRAYFQWERCISIFHPNPSFTAQWKFFFQIKFPYLFAYGVIIPCIPCAIYVLKKHPDFRMCIAIYKIFWNYCQIPSLSSDKIFLF